MSGFLSFQLNQFLIDDVNGCGVISNEVLTAVQSVVVGVHKITSGDYLGKRRLYLWRKDDSCLVCSVSYITNKILINEKPTPALLEYRGRIPLSEYKNLSRLAAVTTNSFTIQFDILISSVVGGMSLQEMDSPPYKYLLSSTDGWWSGWIFEITQSLQLSLRIGTGTTWLSTPLVDPLTPNRWYTVLGVYDHSIKVFSLVINAVTQSVINLDTHGLTYIPSWSPTRVGFGPHGTCAHPVKGHLKRIRLFNSVIEISDKWCWKRRKRKSNEMRDVKQQQQQQQAQQNQIIRLENSINSLTDALQTISSTLVTLQSGHVSHVVSVASDRNDIIQPKQSPSSPLQPVQPVTNVDIPVDDLTEGTHQVGEGDLINENPTPTSPSNTILGKWRSLVQSEPSLSVEATQIKSEENPPLTPESDVSTKWRLVGNNSPGDNEKPQPLSASLLGLNVTESEWSVDESNLVSNLELTKKASAVLTIDVPQEDDNEIEIPTDVNWEAFNELSVVDYPYWIDQINSRCPPMYSARALGKISEVDQNIFIGCAKGARNIRDLKQKRITKVVNLAPQQSRTKKEMYDKEGIGYLEVDAHDDGDYQLLENFCTEKIYDFVGSKAERVHNNERVLIHCFQGVNRSASAISSLLLDSGIDLLGAVKKIHTARPVVFRGNDNFLKQLIDKAALQGLLVNREQDELSPRHGRRTSKPLDKTIPNHGRRTTLRTSGDEGSPYARTPRSVKTPATESSSARDAFDEIPVIQLMSSRSKELSSPTATSSRFTSSVVDELVHYITPAPSPGAATAGLHRMTLANQISQFSNSPTANSSVVDTFNYGTVQDEDPNEVINEVQIEEILQSMPSIPEPHKSPPLQTLSTTEYDPGIASSFDNSIINIQQDDSSPTTIQRVREISKIDNTESSSVIHSPDNKDLVTIDDSASNTENQEAMVDDSQSLDHKNIFKTADESPGNKDVSAIQEGRRAGRSRNITDYITGSPIKSVSSVGDRSSEVSAIRLNADDKYHEFDRSMIIKRRKQLAKSSVILSSDQDVIHDFDISVQASDATPSQRKSFDFNSPSTSANRISVPPSRAGSVFSENSTGIVSGTSLDDTLPLKSNSLEEVASDIQGLNNESSLRKADTSPLKYSNESPPPLHRSPSRDPAERLAKNNSSSSLRKLSTSSSRNGLHDIVSSGADDVQKPTSSRRNTFFDNNIRRNSGCNPLDAALVDSPCGIYLNSSPSCGELPRKAGRSPSLDNMNDLDNKLLRDLSPATGSSKMLTPQKSFSDAINDDVVQPSLPPDILSPRLDTLDDFETKLDKFMSPQRTESRTSLDFNNTTEIIDSIVEQTEDHPPLDNNSPDLTTPKQVRSGRRRRESRATSVNSCNEFDDFMNHSEETRSGSKQLSEVDHSIREVDNIRRSSVGVNQFNNITNQTDPVVEITNNTSTGRSGRRQRETRKTSADKLDDFMNPQNNTFLTSAMRSTSEAVAQIDNVDEFNDFLSPEKKINQSDKRKSESPNNENLPTATITSPTLESLVNFDQQLEDFMSPDRGPSVLSKKPEIPSADVSTENLKERAVQPKVKPSNVFDDGLDTFTDPIQVSNHNIPPPSEDMGSSQPGRSVKKRKSVSIMDSLDDEFFHNEFDKKIDNPTVSQPSVVDVPPQTLSNTTLDSLAGHDERSKAAAKIDDTFGNNKPITETLNSSRDVENDRWDDWD